MRIFLMRRISMLLDLSFAWSYGTRKKWS